ncbi:MULTISPECIES: sucrose-specific PTS transporter subunit IIBC [Staphylococcus]|jgi:PTS system sucrose-specific IIC component|uniref:protein-N(pi)-phosphohistidine--sucrose phosphotransferase n=1 Tax=Staphylococcus hominis TaxID=1290 RepID=A0A533J164_STAHO|nr:MULTISPECIES: sucrose-specific PTS transporter subunit IIBC [Staphylococcus]OFM61150.1 PTS maltose transporter subunit IIBC [Staphylococcus sp. HMSC062C01]OFM94480.1 PTS maltose transporter subunit IIBC [Staphylococcus sp. HMSC078D05]GGO37736.1 PTS sucrose transporter subunit IIBC [Plantactinospora veratri]EHR86105.1 PTS system sucrose-specific IIBC component [Staphylococcus hominis VCU122]KMU55763.1 PTS system, sucrose-specific IIB component / PTS system, sucrose-specific IIC component [St
MSYKKSAEDILEAIGGEDNLDAMAHCATRLRLVLKDESIIDEKKLSEMDVVKGTFSTGGQYQIIIGSGTVNKVFAELEKITGKEPSTTADVKDKSSKHMNPLQRFVKMLSDIFVPIIPAIVAGGLLMGINNLLTAPDLFYHHKSFIDVHSQFAGLADMINVFANAPFTLLPILIGFSASKRFGGNPFLGAALGMILVHPSLMSAYDFPKAVEAGKAIPHWDLFGLHINQVGYQGQVLPMLVAAYILATIEKGLRKIIPTVLDNLLTPLLAILSTAFLTFLFVGPITRQLGYWLSDGLTWLYEFGGAIGGFIFGLFYAPIVITGMHHSFIAVETTLIADQAKTGGSFIFPIATMSNVAQGGAALAAFLIIKNNKKLKGVASAAGISALLGITEPALFGVNLKLRYPFIGAITGSAIGSAYISFFKVKAIALGTAGLPGFISINPAHAGWLHYFIGMFIAFIIAVIVTLVLSRRKAYKAAAE